MLLQLVFCSLDVKAYLEINVGSYIRFSFRLNCDIYLNGWFFLDADNAVVLIISFDDVWLAFNNMFSFSGSISHEFWFTLPSRLSFVIETSSNRTSGTWFSCISRLYHGDRLFSLSPLSYRLGRSFNLPLDKWKTLIKCCLA